MLLENTHHKAIPGEGGSDKAQPYELIVNMMIEMSQRLNNSEATFSPHMLIPLIERYALQESQTGQWVPNLFIKVHFPFETILAVLQAMWYNNIAPFTGKRKSQLASHIVYILEAWYRDCVSQNAILFGGYENMEAINDLLGMLEVDGDLTQEEKEALLDIRRKILRNRR